MVFQKSFEIATRGRGSYLITQEIQGAVAEAGIRTGIAQVFVHHTSASLMLCENADPEVRADLERFMARLAPDGDPLFRHDDEGPDDMPAHARAALTATSLSIPLAEGRLALGTWQGIYLYEHRTAPRTRRVAAHLIGE